MSRSRGVGARMSAIGWRWRLVQTDVRHPIHRPLTLLVVFSSTPRCLDYVAGVALAPAAFASHDGLSVGDSQPSGRSTPTRGLGSGGMKKLGLVTPYSAMKAWF